jgi:transcriptional regulator with XRE-family HTH domain
MCAITHKRRLADVRYNAQTPDEVMPPTDKTGAFTVPNNVSLHLANELRRHRHAKGWSLDQAASHTGVSKAMLGQIERGESSPTVATLWKIASGFECSLSGFLSAPAAPPNQPVFRQADTLRSKPAQDEMLVAPLFPYDPHFAFELLELTLFPGYIRLSEAHATGVTEHLTVIAGCMDVLIDDCWHALKSGAAVRFAADAPHGYRNLNDTPAVCHNLIHYPPGTPV